MAKAQATGERIPEGYQKTSISNFTPEMMDLFKNLFQYLGPDSFMGKLAAGDENMFNEMEKPALKQFAGIQGQIGSRFSGMGMGAAKSSGFQNTQNQAASDFAGQLQANRVNMRQQAIKDLMGMSNQLLGQRPYDNQLQKEQQEENPWNAIAGQIPGMVMNYATGGNYSGPGSKWGSGSNQMTKEVDMGFRSGAPGYY